MTQFLRTEEISESQHNRYMMICNHKVCLGLSFYQFNKRFGQEINEWQKLSIAAYPQTPM